MVYEGVTTDDLTERCTPATAKIVKTIDGFNWLVREQAYDSDFEPLRNYEVSVFDILKEIGDKDGDIFVDIGANSGAHTVRLAYTYNKVVAIEPDPGNIVILKKNIEINKLTNVEIVEIGCSDKKGQVKFLSGGAQAMVTDKGNISINIDTLDNILKSIDIENVTVIKIDTEGHEEKVLKGGIETIKRWKPAILVEHHEYRGDLIKVCAGMRERIRDYLTALGYVGINIDFVHWLYITGEDMKYNMTKYQEAVFDHWFNYVIDNLKNKRDWYYGLSGNWWHGMGIIDFYKELPRHIADGDKGLIEIKI